MTTHTPTPWKDYGVANQINGADNSFVCQFHKEADKDFALRAVNSHDDLIKALKEAQTLIQAMDEYIVKNSPDTCERANELCSFANDIGAKIDGTIAKAEGSAK